ncbi:MAG TPA: hypothetical protein VEY05_12850 [Beijerinckiaceae bacterium]|nr:hypothetical protein [Beijerinckiaceae bacterium]
MATGPDVATLEREAAEARARLADTLERLTSPQTSQAVKQELTDYALGVKDNILGTGRSRALSLKDRALANPLGLLMIGAGIGWRLYRHPPVATLLVGTGIAMLMKGDNGRRLDASAYRDPYDPAQPRGYVPGGVAGYGYPVEDSPPGLADRASAAISHAGYAAEDVKARALDTAHNVAERISGTAHTVADRASETAHTVGERVSDTAHAIADSVSGTAHTVAERVSDAAAAAKNSALGAAGAAKTAISDATGTTREAVMGAADTAKTAFSGATDTARSTAADAVERGAHAWNQARTTTARSAGQAVELAQRNPLLLGALGIAAGTALMYALRSAEGRNDEYERRPARRGARGPRPGAVARSGARRYDDERPSSKKYAASARGETGEGLAASASEIASDVAGSASRALGAAGDAVASSASSAYGAASSVARSAADAAYSAARRAPQAPVYVGDQVAELGERYPLLLGAVSIALGAAVGGALRLSEGENRLMGPLSDRLKQRAWEVADEQYGLAREAAEHFAGELQTRFTGDGDGQDRSADFETVIGGGQPQAASQTPAGRSPAGTAT